MPITMKNRRTQNSLSVLEGGTNFKTVPVPFLLLDRNGTITYANHAASLLIRYRRA